MCFKFIPRSTVTKARLQSFICLPIVSKWDQYIDGNETSSFSKLNPRYGVGIIIKCSVLSSVRGNEGGGGFADSLETRIMQTLLSREKI
jgi:hypothetical protein